MANPNETNVPEAFARHLQAGEELKYFAYGVKQPSLLVIAPLLALAVLPGVIAVTMLTKHYLIGLTNRRFLVLQIKSMGNHEVKAVLEYDLAALQPGSVKASVGPIFTHIRIDDEREPFVAKFHRMGMKTNRDHSRQIAAAISRQPQLAA
jgi:hypothetical protein